MNKPKQVTVDPFELLSSATRQVIGTEPETKLTQPSKQDQPVEEQQLVEKLNIQKTRRLEALEREITDIRNQRNLKPQEESPAEAPKPLEIPTSKPDRKFAGEGLGAKRQQTHIEKLLPPSG